MMIEIWMALTNDELLDCISVANMDSLDDSFDADFPPPSQAHSDADSEGDGNATLGNTLHAVWRKAADKLSVQ